jgi:hypothetical protein
LRPYPGSASNGSDQDVYAVRYTSAGALAAGWAADDGVGLVFEEGAFVEPVTFLEGKAAWRVEPDPSTGGGVRETRHPARLLAATP